jgi:asparagine synthase (glutamine-hydrolysing)
MCGIAGIVQTAGISAAELTGMCRAIAHRGPDGFGYMILSPSNGICVSHNEDLDPELSAGACVGLAHRRLSIIDLSEENSQPMVDRTGNRCVVYNGEIYNYIELREELQKLGYSFRTEGDTEVVLYAYDAWGADCVSRFNGMWAFALLDTSRHTLFLSRDRFGIKPLYYTAGPTGFAFASEIKALLQAAQTHVFPHPATVAEFLSAGLSDTSEDTFYEGIRQLAPGHNAEVDVQSLQPPRITRYWSLPESRGKHAVPEAVEEFRELLMDAVRLHARSDVPVGTCLSGGLDSSSIVCVSEILRKRGEIPRYTHTAFGYCAPEGEFCERKYIELVTQATSIDTNYIHVSQEEFDKSVTKIMACQDEPFGSASIAAQWFVFRRAREAGMKVMLDGQGADEALGGYQHYLITMALRLLSEGDLFRLTLLLARYRARFGAFPLPPNAFSFRKHVARLPRPLAYMATMPSRLARAASKRSPVSKPPEPFSPEMQALVRSRAAPGGYPALDEKLRAQLESESLPALLRYEDRNSMDHSIEARVPFLDYRLIQFVFGLEDSLKIRGATTKYILREAMRGILPEEIRTRRDKIGFKASPGLTARMVSREKESLIRNETTVEREWFRPEGVREFIDLALRTPSLEFMLWRIVNAKLWMRRNWG